MAAIPVIAAGAGIIGTVAGIREQNAAARRTNTANNFMMGASYSSEAARLLAVRTQRQLLSNQYRLQSEQRMTDMQSSVLSYRQELASNQLATALGLDQMTSARSDAEGQFVARENAAAELRDQYTQQGQSAQIEGQSEAVAAQDAARQAASSPELRQAMSQYNDLRGQTDGATATAGSLEGTLNPYIEEAIAQLQQSQSLSAGAQDALRNSTEFRNIMNQLGQFAQQSELSRTASERASMGDSLRVSERAFRREQGQRGMQLAEGLNNVPISAFIDQLQGAKDYRLADYGLLSGVPAIAAAGFAERSALAANRAQPSGFISSLAAIGQSSVPLISTLMQQRALSSQTPTAPMTQAPFLTGEFSTTRLPGLDYYNRGVLTDVNNPIGIYG